MRQIELTIDVSNAVALGERAHVAACVVLPDPERLPDRPVLCFAKPSSAYSRSYYTHDLPGPAAGAQASWHAARGWIFVALDTLGCGASSTHDPELLDFRTVAAAAAAAEHEIRLRLANGVLTERYPPVLQPTVIGIGHAVGGSLVIYQQAHHRCYDGIATLGFSAVHTNFPTPPGGQPVTAAWYPRDVPLHTVPEPLNAAELDDETADQGAQKFAWHSFAWTFHYDDVPTEIVEQDLLHCEAIAQPPLAAQTSKPPAWTSPRTPARIARSTLTPGVVATEAASIVVPVLCAMGERDLVPDPPGEPRAFRSARSVDLFVCPRTGHMHNFASTRELFWERIHSFGEWCAVMRNKGARAR